jgi:uncharacterized protein (DUF1697 family)
MPFHIALLRAINVGGRNAVAMADLRGLCEALGCTGVRSLLQSGNLVFQDRRGGAALERLLEEETRKRLSLAVDYVVRSSAEWQTVIAHNPFPAEAERDPGHLLVLFLKQAAEEKSVQALRSAIRGRESVQADGKQLYLVYPDGIGRSKLTNTLIESKLGVRGTARNWNTILKLAELTQA